MTTKTSSYVYENKIWINQMQDIMRYGYTSKINQKYIKLLEDKLNIKIKIEENLNIYCCLFKSLFNKNKNGFYFKLLSSVDNYSMNLKIFKAKTFFMNINQKSWELSFLIKLNRNDKLLEKMNQFLKILDYLNKINYEKIQDLILITLGDNWKNDIDNILIFIKSLKWIYYKNINFKKNLIRVNKNRKLEFNDDNIKKIIDYSHFNQEYSYSSYENNNFKNLIYNNQNN